MGQIVDRHRSFVNWVGRNGELFVIISTRGPI